MGSWPLEAISTVSTQSKSQTEGEGETFMGGNGKASEDKGVSGQFWSEWRKQLNHTDNVHF